MLEQVILAKYRGFCAGVDYAVNAVRNLIKEKGPPVFVNHPIVHNEHVIDELEESGVSFLDHTKTSIRLARGANLVLSAHGSPKNMRDEAESNGLNVYDAVCPLVRKVHNEAIKKYALGYDLILICHKNHPEAIGTRSYAPMHLVETLEDIENLNIENEKIFCLTQTTLSIDDTIELRNRLLVRYSQIEFPKSDDICYASQNRQNAVKELTELTDLILVIGSNTSSNSKSLVRAAKLHGKPAYLISDHTEIDYFWINEIRKLGIASGASTPEHLIGGTLDYLRKNFGEFIVIDHKIEEGINFAPLSLNK